MLRAKAKSQAVVACRSSAVYTMGISDCFHVSATQAIHHSGRWQEADDGDWRPSVWCVWCVVCVCVSIALRFEA